MEMRALFLTQYIGRNLPHVRCLNWSAVVEKVLLIHLVFSLWEMIDSTIPQNVAKNKRFGGLNFGHSQNPPKISAGF